MGVCVRVCVDACVWACFSEQKPIFFFDIFYIFFSDNTYEDDGGPVDGLPGVQLSPRRGSTDENTQHTKAEEHSLLRHTSP